MRGDDELLREHAEEKARQRLRLAAEARKDGEHPHTAELSGRSGDISGVRAIIVILIIALIINAIFVATSLGAMGGLRSAFFGGIFLMPLIAAPLAVLLTDPKGSARWPMHILIGVVATAMLIGLPIIVNILLSQLLPPEIIDQDRWLDAVEYLGYFFELIPLYLLAGLPSAPITGLALRWLANRKANAKADA
jgi:Na+/melibiose symporter-like transporter